jgi:hypothetical protein
MESSYSKINLGFAEFVSQIIKETFDAILDAQNHQIDKFAELNKALQLTEFQFQERYISDTDLIDEYNASLGFIPALNYKLNENQIKLISLILSPQDLKIAIEKTNITQHGADILRSNSLQKISAEKKSKLRLLVDRPELSRLIVESGEIKAKLELFCLNNFKGMQPIDTNKFTAKTNTKSTHIENSSFSIRDVQMDNGKKFKEIYDKNSQTTTLLIDKNTILNKENTLEVPPHARLIASPVTSSTSTSLFSEVTIKFKSL